MLKPPELQITPVVRNSPRHYLSTECQDALADMNAVHFAQHVALWLHLRVSVATLTVRACHRTPAFLKDIAAIFADAAADPWWLSLAESDTRNLVTGTSTAEQLCRCRGVRTNPQPAPTVKVSTFQPHLCLHPGSRFAVLPTRM